MRTGKPYMHPDRFAMRQARRKEIFGYAGQAAGFLGKITGFGDYTMKYNSVMSSMDPSQVQADYVPVMGNVGSSRSVRIRHREFIQDVSSSTGFQNLSFQLNPANAACFPWLNQIAQNFQEYRMHGLVFQFQSTSSDALNSTNTALGTVIMSTDYNAGNAPYASKQAAENSEFTVSCRPSASMMHGVECDPDFLFAQGHLYVSPFNNGTVPANQDIKTFNQGLFQFMTSGSQASAVIGELWVTYDIELIKPIDNAQLFRSAADHYSLNDVGHGSNSNGYKYGFTRTQLLNGIGTTITSSAASDIITFPASAVPGQRYQVLYSVGVSGSGVTPTAPAFTLANCDGLNVFFGQAGFSQYTLGTLVPSYLFCVFLTIGASATSIAPATLTLAGSLVSPGEGGDNVGDLMIIQVPGNFV